jgi:DNA-binding transcriptional ArsR family regulator
MLLTDKGKPDTTARHVLAALAEFAETDGSEARPALITLQHRTGYDRRTIQRALRRLEGGGLVRAEGTKFDCTIYRLAMHLMRPASDMDDLKAEEMRQKEGDAERQRRSRAKRVTHANDVTVTDAECVTVPDVTDADDVSHAFSVPTSRTQNPDVTDATPPNPSFDPPRTLPLSPAAGRAADAARAVTDEREIDASPDNSNNDTAKVAEAWSAARGRGRNPAAEQRVRESAALLLSVGWSIPDVIALAEDMGVRQPSFTDLAKHEPHWQRPVAGGVVPPSLPPWCTRCGGGWDAARTNPRFRKTPDGAPCPACHPDAIAA